MTSWQENVRRVVPYTPGEQPKALNIIKLNTNENPYPPAPAVKRVLAEFDYDQYRRYPDPAVTQLVEAIAAYKGLSPEQVFVGVGSDDVLAMAFITFFNSSKSILFPDITYSFYDVWAELFGISYTALPLEEDFTISPEAYKVPNGGVVIPNPNAPTSIEAPQQDIEEIIAANPGSVVIIDEAYVDFGGTSVLPLIEKYDNLLVVQTFSKSRSLAGGRIGFAMGSPALIKYLNDCKYSFNSYTMDRLTIELGSAAIADDAYFTECTSKIIATREWTVEQLESIGFSVLPSKANFVFASHSSVPAEEIFAKLKERSIFVRYFKKPRIDNFLRITIGTDQEMAALMEALKEICG